MKNTISNLKSSPLFYLFNASKELFHSNFWYWLSTLNSTETIKVLTGIESTDGSQFKREHNQQCNKIKSKVDLLITLDNGQKIIIENKIKDFPKDDQLDRIIKSVGDEKAMFCLITLFSYENMAFKGWTIRSYKQITEAIVPENFCNNEYYIQIISDYKIFVKNLVDLSNLLPITNSYDFPRCFSSNFDYLNEIKLWEAYQKMRSSHLTKMYESFKPRDLNVHYSINNQRATIDFEYRLYGSYKIGIQIEDKQFRKYIAGEKAEKFGLALLNKEIFFNANFKNRNKQPFLKYDENFRYQYESINTMSYIDLFAKINDELQNIKSLESEILECMP